MIKILAGLSLNLALALSVCMAPAASAASAASLRWAAQNDVLTLDPQSQDHTPTHAILSQVYESMVRYNEKFEIEPALATKWTYISPTQVRFDLRRGVKFQDGTPFTADDVIFSFKRILQPQGTMQIYVTGIKEIRKIDEHTVDLMLDAPTPMLLHNLIAFRIMSQVWAEKNKATQIPDFKSKEESYSAHHAMGTGPYKIISWLPDQKISMVANPDWWDHNKGNVTELTYTPIKSDPTRVASLISGDVDLLTDVPTQDVAKIKAEPGLKVIDGAELRTVFFAMDEGSDELLGSNIKGKNPFKDGRVREALSIAIDREAIHRTIMRGFSVPAALIVPPGANGYADEINAVPKVDPVRARKLLADAGYPQGFEVPLYCPNNRYVNDEAICQAVVAMWAKIGVQAKLIAQPMSLHTQQLERFQAPIYMLGWAAGTRDALYVLQALARTRSGGPDGSFNFSKVSNPKLDALIDAMKHEIDEKKRDALIREALLLVRDENLFIPLHYQVRPWAMKANVKTLYRSDDQPKAQFTTVK